MVTHSRGNSRVTHVMARHLVFVCRVRSLKIIWVDKGCTGTVRDEVKRLKVRLLYYNLVIHFYLLLDGTIEAQLVHMVGFKFLFGHIVWISLASLVETPVLLAHIETGFAC